jgi:DNA-binding NtrC family response regulator
VQGISTDALRLLEQHQWPGNVRELENSIRAAVILADRIIRPPHLPAAVRGRAQAGEASSDSGERLTGRGRRPIGDLTLAEIGRYAAEEAQRVAVMQVLEDTGWNKAETARRLRIDYKALHLKLQRWGLRAPKP